MSGYAGMSKNEIEYLANEVEHHPERFEKFVKRGNWFAEYCKKYNGQFGGTKEEETKQ